MSWRVQERRGLDTYALSPRQAAKLSQVLGEQLPAGCWWLVLYENGTGPHHATNGLVCYRITLQEAFSLK
jgi:hypothetical protein